MSANCRTRIAFAARSTTHPADGDIVARSLRSSNETLCKYPSLRSQKSALTYECGSSVALSTALDCSPPSWDPDSVFEGRALRWTRVARGARFY